MTIQISNDRIDFHKHLRNDILRYLYTNYYGQYVSVESILNIFDSYPRDLILSEIQYLRGRQGGYGDHRIEDYIEVDYRIDKSLYWDWFEKPPTHIKISNQGIAHIELMKHEEDFQNELKEIKKEKSKQ